MIGGGGKSTSFDKKKGGVFETLAFKCKDTWGLLSSHSEGKVDKDFFRKEVRETRIDKREGNPGVN